MVYVIPCTLFKSYYELILIYNFEQKYYTSRSGGAKLFVYSIFTLGVSTVLVVMYIHWIVMDHCFLICFNHVPLFNAKFTLDGVCTNTL